MTKEKRFHITGAAVTQILNVATDKADQIQSEEDYLIRLLFEIDRHRYYVRYGFKSLKGFCTSGLKFSRTRSQSLVTRVRQFDLEKTIHKELNLPSRLVLENRLPQPRRRPPQLYGHAHEDGNCRRE